MKNAHGRTCKKTKVYIYLYISPYENVVENGCIYICSDIRRILHILRKPNSIIVLLFIQYNSKFKNKLKRANLSRYKFISIRHLYGKVCLGLQLYSKHQILSVELSSCCSCDVSRQYFAVKRVKCSSTVLPFCSNYQNNSTSFPGFLGQQFNNLQPGCTFDVFLTSSVQYDKTLFKFGQQQLVMVNYACGEIF